MDKVAFEIEFGKPRSADGNTRSWLGVEKALAC